LFMVGLNTLRYFVFSFIFVPLTSRSSLASTELSGPLPFHAWVARMTFGSFLFARISDTLSKVKPFCKREEEFGGCRGTGPREIPGLLIYLATKIAHNSQGEHVFVYKIYASIDISQ